MIRNQMKPYNYFLYGTVNEYGEDIQQPETIGTVKMAINLITETLTDNAIYSDASYIGLTFEDIDESYVIQKGAERLKVIYVNKEGRYNQVFLKKI